MFGLNLLFTAPAAQAHRHAIDFCRDPLLAALGVRFQSEGKQLPATALTSTPNLSHRPERESRPEAHHLSVCGREKLMKRTPNWRKHLHASLRLMTLAEEVLFNFNKKKKKGYDPNWEALTGAL